jgi:3-hydroxyacyl-[acyl-carrier protein] dehydratase/trans-2-decenoyl-[acyl-carrier protein] isomerase
MTFIPASSYTKDDLVACGNGDLFGPSNGRLPADEMLMFDSIDQIDKTSGKYSKGKIIANLEIEQSLWFFKVHFKSDPVMPGCLGLDAMWQLLGFYLCWLELPGYGRALGSDKVKFFGQVTPSAKTVRYEIDIKRVINRGAVVGFADGNMFVDDRHVYSADGLRVGLFKDTSEF